MILTGTRRRGGRRWSGFSVHTWSELGYLLLGVPSTVLGWVVAVVVVVVAVVMSLTVVGAAVTPALLVLVRVAAGLERWRCAMVLSRAPARPYRPAPLIGRAAVRLRVGDPATWRDLAWLMLGAPVALACALVAVSWWALALGSASIPIWYRYLPGGQARLYESGGVSHGVIDSVPTALPWAAAGLALLALAGWVTRILAGGQARLAAALLGPTRAARLRARVATLTSTRAAAVNEQHRELSRIERDLHDGAQARLVAVSADLGLAREAFDQDPHESRHLVDQARHGLTAALAELRDLVRGIGPPVLRDRGLTAALEAVTARSPIPVTTTVALADRLPAAIEAAAYFLVCECLTNAAKHSAARSLTVDIRRSARACAVTVTDDGTGGADPGGPGLTGMADRVAALDGSLMVDSPAGGPTVVRAVLPCGS